MPWPSWNGDALERPETSVARANLVSAAPSVFQIAYQLPGCTGHPVPLSLWFPPHLSVLVFCRVQAHLMAWCVSEERDRFFAILPSKVLHLGQALEATRTHIGHENKQIWTLEISFHNYIGYILGVRQHEINLAWHLVLKYWRIKGLYSFIPLLSLNPFQS